MKTALEFNAKLRIEDIFKLTIRNKSLHQESNDSGVLEQQTLSYQKI
jgi:hypothetical protein